MNLVILRKRLITRLQWSLRNSIAIGFRSMMTFSNPQLFDFKLLAIATSTLTSLWILATAPPRAAMVEKEPELPKRASRPFQNPPQRSWFRVWCWGGSRFQKRLSGAKRGANGRRWDQSHRRKQKFKGFASPFGRRSLQRQLQSTRKLKTIPCQGVGYRCFFFSIAPERVDRYPKLL